MTSDVPPMDPCPYTKSGRHEIMVITPGTDDGDLTFVCHGCGAIRRVPAVGGIQVPLDDQPAWVIIRAVNGEE